ncbi:MAG: NRDE family protein [Geminicoccaceae bacterium]|nr:NRDE family protein [Geminicoccaceae bacterium]
MCTLVMLRRPTHEQWPVLIAANRDELSTRPARPPGRYWEDRDEIRAGLDVEAGGSWFGVNDYGVMAAVLNRRGTLGPEAGKRSRGELVLEALDYADAEAAAAALAHLDPEGWRPFNLIIADNRDAFWIRHAGDGMLSSIPILNGVTMATAGELNDTDSARVRRYLPLFRSAEAPDPGKGDWSSWQLLLSSTSSETGDPRDAMCIRTDGAYGTVSSSLLALPADIGDPPAWLFADGPPDRAAYEPVGD